jgi:hypothetical protein
MLLPARVCGSSIGPCNRYSPSMKEIELYALCVPSKEKTPAGWHHYDCLQGMPLVCIIVLHM